MSLAADADIAPLKEYEPVQSAEQQVGNMTSNHASPEQVVSDETNSHNETVKEDPATSAASEELKQTTISDNAFLDSNSKSTTTGIGPIDKDMKEAVKDNTPEPLTTDSQDEEMKERVSSPKKKRARDTYDESKELESGGANHTDLSDGSASGSGLEREGPEKKRPRDTSAEAAEITERATKGKVRPINAPHCLVVC